MQVSMKSAMFSVKATSPTATSPTAAKAADGDYKVKGASTSQVKDSDGDYKPKTAVASSSSGIQSALSALKLGGS